MRVLTVLCLLAATCLAFEGNYLSNTFYSRLKSGDSSLLGMNVLTQSAGGGIIPSATISLGVSDFINNYKLWQDNAFYMNTGSELLYVTAAMRLVSLNVLPALSAPIPATFMPRGVDFANPSYPSTPITLDMLMRHTSTLSDATFESRGKSSAVGPVEEFRTFCESYFTTATVTNGVTTYATSLDIWTSTGTPGATSSYLYSRFNTALLAYVVDAAITASQSLVTGPTKTAAGYVQEVVLNQLGMASTFRRNLDGSLPTSSLPAGMGLYSGAIRLVDVTSAGGLKSDAFIHPAYPSDYMYYTTTENMGRMLRSLYIDTNGFFNSVGTQMRVSPLTISTSNTNRKIAQIGQGYGLMFFDGAEMCAAAGNLAPVTATSCMLTNRMTIFGNYHVGLSVMWGYFCTNANTQATVGMTCTTVMLNYFTSSSGARDPSMLLGAAALSLSAVVGSVDAGGQQYASEERGFDESMNGLWVTLGTCLVIVFVIAAAYFTEYLVQPAPVPSGVVAAPPPIPQAYAGHGSSGAGFDGYNDPGMYGDASGGMGYYHD